METRENSTSQRLFREIEKVDPIRSYVPLREQMKHRLERIGRKLGVGRKRICKEAFVSYTSANNYLRNTREITTGTYDRLAMVCCHYEFIADLSATVEQERWKRVGKSYKKNRRLPD